MLLCGAAVVLGLGLLLGFLATRGRHKVFSQDCLRPLGPLVTNSKQRDEVLKKGEFQATVCDLTLTLTCGPGFLHL